MVNEGNQTKKDYMLYGSIYRKPWDRKQISCCQDLVGERKALIKKGHKGILGGDGNILHHYSLVLNECGHLLNSSNSTLKIGDFHSA